MMTDSVNPLVMPVTSPPAPTVSSPTAHAEPLYLMTFPLDAPTVDKPASGIVVNPAPEPLNWLVALTTVPVMLLATLSGCE
jgi:hypothetical protein